MKELIRRLEEESFKNVKFRRGWVSLEYDGKKLKNQIVIEKHQKFVGRWDQDINAVYLDDDLEGIDMEAVAVHETIEKYISQKYEFDPYREAHAIATLKEKEFIKENKGNWQSHQLKVAHIWRKESKRSY